MENNKKKNNWEVGEVYKRPAFSLDRLNIHDPNNLYEWVDDQPSWLLRAVRMAFVATKLRALNSLYLTEQAIARHKATQQQHKKDIERVAKAMSVVFNK